ncbi:DNA-processing protein DprA [Nocardia farcinica]|nr:DNA-processing protein DprA [Nocardia farcinica]
MSSPVYTVGDFDRRLAFAVLSRAAARGHAVDAQAVIDVVEAADRLGHEQAHQDLPALARADLGRAYSSGARLITPDDHEWPHAHLASVRAVDESVVPVALWARGTGRLSELVHRAVLVTGSRAASPYGCGVAEHIAGDLAREGWTVTAGLAYGIEAVAHESALSCPAPTLAVLSSGIDRPAPARHAELCLRISAAGLVISEHPPGAAASRGRRLACHRLLAALSTRIAIIEAGRSSDALQLARWGTRWRRPIHAVPGPVDSVTSVGCHTLIRDGAAALATSAADIIRESDQDQSESRTRR